MQNVTAQENRGKFQVNQTPTKILLPFMWKIQLIIPIAIFVMNSKARMNFNQELENGAGVLQNGLMQAITLITKCLSIATKMDIQWFQ